MCSDTVTGGLQLKTYIAIGTTLLMQYYRQSDGLNFNHEMRRVMKKNLNYTNSDLLYNYVCWPYGKHQTTNQSLDTVGYSSIVLPLLYAVCAVKVQGHRFYLIRLGLRTKRSPKLFIG